MTFPFRKTGLWPMDKSELPSHPLPTISTNVGHVLTIEKMCGLLERKGTESGTKLIGIDVQVTSSGYITTKQGMVLTSDRAMSSI